MIQIKCDKCATEFAITRSKCPKCGDPVKTSCKFYCGDCEEQINIKDEICQKCGKKPEEIIIEQSNGKRIRTTFDTADSEEIEISTEIEEAPEVLPKSQEKTRKLIVNDMLLLFIFQIIAIIFSIVQGGFSIQSIGFAVLCFFGYMEAKKGTPSAGTIAIVVGLLMICTIIMFDIFDFILGIFVLIRGITYSKQFKN